MPSVSSAVIGKVTLADATYDSAISAVRLSMLVVFVGFAALFRGPISGFARNAQFVVARMRLHLLQSLLDLGIALRL